jgi:hypothetical protein
VRSPFRRPLEMGLRRQKLGSGKWMILDALAIGHGFSFGRAPVIKPCISTEGV